MPKGIAWGVGKLSFKDGTEADWTSLVKPVMVVGEAADLVQALKGRQDLFVIFQGIAFAAVGMEEVLRSKGADEYSAAWFLAGVSEEIGSGIPAGQLFQEVIRYVELRANEGEIRLTTPQPGSPKPSSLAFVRSLYKAYGLDADSPRIETFSQMEPSIIASGIETRIERYATSIRSVIAKMEKETGVP